MAAELQLMVELGYTRFKVVQQADVPGSRIETRTLAGETLHHVFPEHSSGPFGADLGEAWLSHADALRAYRRIFWAYRLFGDRWPFYRTSAGRSLSRSSRGSPGDASPAGTIHTRASEW